MKPITDIMREIRKGRAVDLASQMLAEVVRAVDETGKPGTITIKVSIKPEKGGGNQKTLTMTTESKVPRPDVPDAIFFSDEAGDLHRSDPQQKEMFSATDGERQRVAENA
jgi:hypothetical protein